jgi:hypothetical protein
LVLCYCCLDNTVNLIPICCFNTSPKKTVWIWKIDSEGSFICETAVFTIVSAMSKLVGLPCLNLIATAAQQRVPGRSFAMVKPNSLWSGSFTHRQADTDTTPQLARYTVQRTILPILLYVIITRRYILCSNSSPFKLFFDF